MVKKMALGRGLGALIEDAEPLQQRKEAVAPSPARLIGEIAVDDIAENPFQPRTTFDPEAMEELAGSIRELGIIQPLTLRALDDGKYQLIAGERRLRAARMVGLKSVPAYIRTANDQGLLEMALVENIQRQDLDAIEVAITYQRLIDECHLTHETLSERVAKKRATITNYLRLLRLPAEIQLAIREQRISMGHARALVAIEDPIAQLKIFRQALKQELSVRSVEELARRVMEGKAPEGPPAPAPDELPEPLRVAREYLNQWLGWGAEVKSGPKGSGKIIIAYRNPRELEEIIEKFRGLNG